MKLYLSGTQREQITHSEGLIEDGGVTEGATYRGGGRAKGAHREWW